MEHARRLELAGPHVAQRNRLALKQGQRRAGCILPGDGAVTEFRLQRLHHMRKENDGPSLSELERVLPADGRVVTWGLSEFATREKLTAGQRPFDSPSPFRMSLTAPLSIASSDSATSGKVAMTVVIPTLNEGAQIAEAIDALLWIDEIIVVDGGSMDDTATLAEGAGARVIVVMGETIAGQRNAGVATARNQWVLALDAD